jgi:hypothetical protein
MTTAASTNFGKNLKSGVKNRRMINSINAVSNPDICETAPVELLTADREKLPATGYDEKMEPTKFANPSPSNSCPASTS